jgi:type IV pilus assembly protein PilQ
MFTGKDITYVKDGSAYIIGDKKLNDFKVSRIIKFNYRPVDSLLTVIPKEFTQDISLKEFPDLNSILASGSNERIRVFEDFCAQIDKSVPVIMIEVIIVDIQSTTTLETGLNAGFGQAPATTKGTVLPGVDLQLSTKAINSLIEGVGLANLGKVSNNFYLNIKAMESLGALKVRSTPILSTLNGHEAKINIGETEYYLVKQSNVVAGQTQVVSETINYSNVDAKLEVVIKPFVSGDDQITLNVKVTQSDFTERISEFAPPGLVSRDFSSKIRVKNQDMVLLGGLEEKSTRESSSGIPLLQRIPIIKWFFSSRTREKSDTKLNIFIRPTIIG